MELREETNVVAEAASELSYEKEKDQTTPQVHIPLSKVPRHLPHFQRTLEAWQEKN